MLFRSAEEPDHGSVPHRAAGGRGGNEAETQQSSQHGILILPIPVPRGKLDFSTDSMLMPKQTLLILKSVMATIGT